MKALDNQQIELLGKSILCSELIKHNFEIAEPARDKGFDLIIYTEPSFHAVPVQMKASRSKAFGAWKKYEKFEEIIFAYVWNILDVPRIFFLDYQETLQFVPSMEGASWVKNKCYTWSDVPPALEEQLKAFENRWEYLHNRVTGG